MSSQASVKHSSMCVCVTTFVFFISRLAKNRKTYPSSIPRIWHPPRCRGLFLTPLRPAGFEDVRKGLLFLDCSTTEGRGVQNWSSPDRGSEEGGYAFFLIAS